MKYIDLVFMCFVLSFVIVEVCNMWINYTLRQCVKKSTPGSFQGQYKRKTYMQKITNFVEEDLTISMFINFNQGHYIDKGSVYVPFFIYKLDNVYIINLQAVYMYIHTHLFLLLHVLYISFSFNYILIRFNGANKKQ